MSGRPLVQRMKLQTKEVKVPAGYGAISVKVWGEKSDGLSSIIALHGWMDNGSTFDPLIENLSEDWHVIAVDLPGHGFSSHYPPGVPYRNLSWIIDIRRIVKYFELDKIIFLGHSLGASLSLLYASIYTDQVEKIVSLDIIQEATIDDQEVPRAMATSVNQFLEGEKRPTIDRGFTYDQCVQILIEAHSNGKIDQKMAEFLLRRAVMEKPDGYHFTRDARLTILVNQKFSFDYLANLYSNMKCELLVLRGNQGTADLNKPHVRKMLEIHKKRGNFTIKTIVGDHYFHLARPLDTARHVNEFLSNKTKN